jgi:hypothetical protein
MLIKDLISNGIIPRDLFILEPSVNDDLLPIDEIEDLFTLLTNTVLLDRPEDKDSRADKGDRDSVVD